MSATGIDRYVSTRLISAPLVAALEWACADIRFAGRDTLNWPQGGGLKWPHRVRFLALL